MQFDEKKGDNDVVQAAAQWVGAQQTKGHDAADHVGRLLDARQTNLAYKMRISWSMVPSNFGFNAQ